MGDLISRQDAIDAFKKELTVGESKSNYVTICSAISYEGAKQILENLPSAEPEPMCVAKVTLTDEQVKEAFEKAKCEILAVQSAELEQRECILTIWGKCSYSETGCSDCLIKNKITTALSAQPRPRGKWVNPTDGGWSIFLDCSKCGITLQWLDHEEYPKFCPMCGADMRQRGEQE